MPSTRQLRILLPLLLALSSLLPSPEAMGAAQTATPVLRVLAWPGYADADVVKAFEQQHNVRVEVTLVGSDDVLRQKIQANHGSDYDVFAINTAELQRYINQGLVQPVDQAAIPNTRRQLPRFRNLQAIPGLMRNGRAYGIPYTYSAMGLVYDRDQFPTPPDSVNVLWDARYQRRVIAYNAANHNFSLAAIAAGSSPFNLQPADWSRLSDKLIALRRNALAFYTLPDESVQLFIQHRAALMFANYGTQQVQLLKAAGANVGYVVPKEGALAWLDCWAIARGAKDRQLANAWINHMLEADVSALLVSRQGLANTLTPAATSSPADHLIWLEPLENIERREKLWQRILSGDKLNKVLAP